MPRRNKFIAAVKLIGVTCAFLLSASCAARVEATMALGGGEEKKDLLLSDAPLQHVGNGHKPMPLHLVDFTRDGSRHPSHEAVLGLKPKIDGLTAQLRGLRDYSSFSTLKDYEEAVEHFSDNLKRVQTELSSLCDPIYEALSVVDKETFEIRQRLTSLQESLSIIDVTELNTITKKKSGVAAGQESNGEDRGVTASGRLSGSEDTIEDTEETIRKSRAAVKAQIQRSAETLEDAEVKWAVLATTKQICSQLATHAGAFPQQLEAVRGDLAVIKSRRGSAKHGDDGDL